ncbi:MAG: SURF1 family cytochrome oxidase biogenesis protein [Pseudomonadota bacterium]
MLRNFPIIPTLLVVAAAAIMVALGFWQLGRADEKAEMIARFSAIPTDAPAQALVAEGEWETDLLYRSVMFDCGTPVDMRSTAGTSARGAKGWSHVAQCKIGDDDSVEIALGWSRSANMPDWQGGEVTGVLGPKKKVVAVPALAGLDQLARPDPSDLPNNHMAYAGQWFFFALTALVIYGFAVNKRLRRKVATHQARR